MIIFLNKNAHFRETWTPKKSWFFDANYLSDSQAIPKKMYSFFSSAKISAHAHRFDKANANTAQCIEVDSRTGRMVPCTNMLVPPVTLLVFGKTSIKKVLVTKNTYFSCDPNAGLLPFKLGTPSTKLFGFVTAREQGRKKMLIWEKNWVFYPDIFFVVDLYHETLGPGVNVESYPFPFRIDWFWLPIFPTNLVRGLSNKELNSLRRWSICTRNSKWGSNLLLYYLVNPTIKISL